MKRLVLAAVLAAALGVLGAAIADDAAETPYTVMEMQIVGQDFVGLVPEGIRMDSRSSGVVIEGLLAGATTQGVDYMLYRHDGVGVLDTRGFAVHPDGVTSSVTMKGFLGEPMPGMIEAMLDIDFEPPDVDIPLHGAAWFQTMAPQYAFLNHTVFGCTGTVNLVQGVARITCRSLAP